MSCRVVCVFARRNCTRRTVARRVCVRARDRGLNKLRRVCVFLLSSFALVGVGVVIPVPCVYAFCLCVCVFDKFENTYELVFNIYIIDFAQYESAHNDNVCIAVQSQLWRYMNVCKCDRVCVCFIVNICARQRTK